MAGKYSRKAARLTPERRLALKLMQNGYMMPNEIAEAAGIPASTVRQWAYRAELDCGAMRRYYCRTQWQALMATGDYDKPAWQNKQKILQSPNL